MRPNAEANATPLTTMKRAQSSPVKARSMAVGADIRRRANHAWMVLVSGLVVLTVAVMTASVARADGSFAATDNKRGVGHKGPDLSGRWTGFRAGFGGRARGEGCGPRGCAITYDITRCRDAWCGVRVRDDGTCGTALLSLVEVARPDSQKGLPIHEFTGRLELSAKADGYFVEAHYNAPWATTAARAPRLADSPRRPAETQPPRLTFVGDTGPGLMMFRRSFPFSAELVHQGPTVCTPEKPIS